MKTYKEFFTEAKKFSINDLKAENQKKLSFIKNTVSQIRQSKEIPKDEQENIIDLHESMLKVNNAQIELMQKMKNFKIKDTEEKELVDLIQQTLFRHHKDLHTFYNFFAKIFERRAKNS